MNMDGVYTSLMTGQERKDMPFSKHFSCTVEMVDVNRRVDVAVIDEIQMIGDRHRGAAWTRALLGVAAPEIHVCGDPAAIPVVTSLAALCGDELEIKMYDRMTSMKALETSLNSDYGKIEEGDCIVAFSRKTSTPFERRLNASQPTNAALCTVPCHRRRDPNKLAFSMIQQRAFEYWWPATQLAWALT
jgi:ATP-dependent RNA helicase SUPV3L1/SUV3